MAHVETEEAQRRLPELLERAEAGEEIVIERGGRPVARLVPVDAGPSRESVRGIWRGRVTIAEDFDELPADIAEAFGA